MAKQKGEEPHPTSSGSEAPEYIPPEWWIDHNIDILGQAPAIAMAQTYLTMANSTGHMFHNAVNAQRHLDVVARAATKLEVKTLLGVDVSEELAAALEIEMSALPALIAALNAAKKSAKQAKA